MSYHFLLRDPELTPSLVPRDENLDVKTEVLMTQQQLPKQVNWRLKWRHHRALTCSPTVLSRFGWEAEGNTVLKMTGQLWAQEWTLSPSLALPLRQTCWVVQQVLAWASSCQLSSPVYRHHCTWNPHRNYHHLLRWKSVGRRTDILCDSSVHYTLRKTPSPSLS